MEQKYLIDTNAIIDVQMGRMPKSGMDFMAKVLNHEFLVSFVTYIEFLGYKSVTPDSEAFISMATVLEVNTNVINICIELRKTKRINLPDAIIAATALDKKLVVISRNIKDFAGIEGLQVIDPHSI